MSRERMINGSLRVGLVLAAGALSLAGCKKLTTGAREEFAKKYSCPLDRVGVRLREDLRYGDLVVEEPDDPPPEEVKRDPARLAKFKADRARQLSAARASLNDLDVFE